MAPPPIQTFIFMDFGTEKGNPKVVTSVSLLAARRILYLDLDLPEPTDKLTIGFGQNGFNLNAYTAINDFINKQEKPVCLVSHNGNRFDFLILKRELQRLNVSLPDDVLCADSLYAFYDILENTDEDGNRPLVFEGRAVRRIYFEGAGEPTPSYKLWEIYNRVVHHPPVVPHPPENDNIMIFRISRKLAESFLAWTDQIRRMFAEVEPEEIDMNL